MTGPAPALLLDVEGTTTPIRFVTEILFPYARAGLAGFLSAHGNDPDVREAVARLLEERLEDRKRGADPPDLDLAAYGGAGVVPYVHWLMDHDRKSPGLKALQGRVWEAGYRSGHLRGEVYPDVLPALARWRAQARRAGIFSSGSVLAQKLLFGTTPAGDLTPYLCWHFDTGTGAKADPESYRRIAGTMGVVPGDILFVSDVVAELDAALSAGMRTALCVREAEARPSPPNAPPRHPMVRTLDEID
jgi:enolase-phosphatase E1